LLRTPPSILDREAKPRRPNRDDVGSGLPQRTFERRQARPGAPYPPTDRALQARSSAGGIAGCTTLAVVQLPQARL